MATSSGTPIITPETVFREHWSPSPAVTRKMGSLGFPPAAVRQAGLRLVQGCEEVWLPHASPGILAQKVSKCFIFRAS